MAKRLMDKPIIELCDLRGVPRWAAEVEAEFARRREFTPRELKAITDRAVYIGMRVTALRCGKGMPLEINRTVTAGGSREQWVYNDMYVYVQGERVVAFQD